MRGPCVRWILGDRVLVLETGAGGLQLTVTNAQRLTEGDRLAFDVNPNDLDFTRLPYVWQVQTREPSSGSVVLRAPVAPDWLTLEASLAAVMQSCAQQVPEQFAAEEFLMFDIAARGRTVAVTCSSTSGLIVLVDDRESPGPTPEEEMMRRGWDRELVGWWEHAVVRTDEAAGAAGLLIEELRRGGAETPKDLRTTGLSSDQGYLLLPGLTIGTS
ncbi:hypothetical protein [Streptomyces sp. NPDC093589]|uniref:hypothetical protein n=1 Tax=Streptomyces sp. NPDC093589 TaxID=3366043 RepID=UPI00380827A3